VGGFSISRAWAASPEPVEARRPRCCPGDVCATRDPQLGRHRAVVLGGQLRETRPQMPDPRRDVALVVVTVSFAATHCQPPIGARTLRPSSSFVSQALQALCHGRRRRRRGRLVGSPQVERFLQTLPRQPTKREVDHAPWRCLRPTDVDPPPSSRPLSRPSDTGLGAPRSRITSDHRTRAQSTAASHALAPPRTQQVVSLG
jgi:hypothetical protein